MCKLPRNMFPNQAAFEALGFVFTPTEDSENYQSILPAGWDVKLSDPIGYVNIIDQKGKNRAIYDYMNVSMTMLS